MNNAQEIFGEPANGTKKKVRPYMVELVQDFIKKSPFLVMASCNVRDIVMLHQEVVSQAL